MRCVRGSFKKPHAKGLQPVPVRLGTFEGGENPKALVAPSLLRA